MLVIRWILGRIILLLNFVFPPKKLKRTVAEQAKIDEHTKSLSLYQYAACPFCVKVRRAIRSQGLNIATVDAKQENNKQQLVNEGGQLKVPCLKIEQDGKTQWMYESGDIIAYLSKQYA